MAQIKIYALRQSLSGKQQALSAAIHAAVMEALAYPAEKKFHRFLLLEPDNFLFPADRSEDYTIIEISLFEGRSVEAKKRLIRLLYANIEAAVGIVPQDVEITLFETPKFNWGIRGLPGDELALGYRVNV